MRSIAFYAAIVASLLSGNVLAQQDSDMGAVLERLERLERQQQAQARELAEKDRQIEALESELQRLRGEPVVSTPRNDAPLAADSNQESPSQAVVASTEAPEPIQPDETIATSSDQEEPAYFGQFQPGGKGFKIADTPYGDLNFSFYTYARYLNQSGLDETYTDAFDRTRMLDIRQDFQFQKAVLYFKGWVGDPKLRYLAYVWSANTSQGQSAQVVVAGNLTYVFNPAFNLGIGISGLPTTRSTEGSFPNWLRVDNRTIADEFFRGSYTTGVFAFGQISDTLKYSTMLGNNLSQLGVDAGQLDDTLDTWAGALIWNPLGPYFNGFGDFEQSEDFITRLALHYTHSTEDRQNQPGLDDPENSQIRLSDGTVLFSENAFNTDGRVNRARYRMLSLDGGFKYNGWALEGEYYYRWVDDFVTEGFVPVSELEDHGFQLQASAMIIPKTFQAYLSGSKIYGEFGDPWDLAVGVNWFPYRNRQFRLNGEVIFIEDSPVGYYSVPYIVGADGTIFHANAELRF